MNQKFERIAPHKETFERVTERGGGLWITNAGTLRTGLRQGKDNRRLEEQL